MKTTEQSPQAKKSWPGFLRLTAGILVLLFTVFLLDYITLPAWNLQDFSLWIFLAVVIFGVFTELAWIFKSKKLVKWGLFSGGGIFILSLILSMGSWLVWPGNDVKYQTQMVVEEVPGVEFLTQFAGASPTVKPGATVLLPTIDKDLSITLAMGKLGTYGTQFQFDSEIFSSINVISDGVQRMVRITALEYASPFVALGGGDKGAPGYIEVDQGTTDVRLVETESGLRYLPSGIFGYDLSRHLRFLYRGYLFGSWSFEIDDQGKPWWIVPVLQNTVGLFGGAEQIASLVVDPMTGAVTEYKRGAEPGWIDRIIPSDLVLEQANNYLGLKNGWFNRTLGTMEGVFQVSDGYNYVSTVDGKEGRTWLVTGITSPNEADQTSVGLLAVDLKTKETTAFMLNGITEMRARDIAENDERVRAQYLGATWPVLVVIQGAPAYYMLLKNNVQRQRFVLIDAVNGSQVAMDASWEGTLSQFSNRAGGSFLNQENLEELDGNVFRISEAEDGMIVFLLSGDRSIRYLVPKDLNNGTRFLATGDRITIKFREGSRADEKVIVTLENQTLEN